MVFQESFKKSFKEDSRVFQESFKGVSRKIEGCLKGVYSGFEGCSIKAKEANHEYKTLECSIPCTIKMQSLFFNSTNESN